ncbi:unnamed protein product [Cyprideis torosa]|uniref:Uncharacterized protein n=1 Tax=Cyprideis torosa TaxID=163714 RepID=A0A7R8W5P1_9CRUS|nr:unnamed protein product [Cyprideis torosa]CAG0885509.1 unnamed protein product [Cyprideis torosa]
MTISSVSEEQSEGSPRGADLSEGALRQRGADLSEGALRQRGPDHSEESSDGGRVPRPVRRYTAWQRRKAERLRVLCEQVKQLNGGRAEGGRAPKSQVAIKESIREMALSQGGLMEDRFRRVLWPQLFEIDPANVQLSAQTEAEVKERCDQFNQVTMDVFRTLRRFPPGITDDDREMYQHQLTGVVCQVLLDHPELYYYQGYHDVALTLLLVVGQRVSLALIEKLSKSHLGTFMEPSMKSTAHLLNYLYPILKGEDEELFAFMLNVLDGSSGKRRKSQRNDAQRMSDFIDDSSMAHQQKFLQRMI